MYVSTHLSDAVLRIPDEDEELENIRNPVEYLSLVKKALFQSRKILEEHDENGHLIQ